MGDGKLSMPNLLIISAFGGMGAATVCHPLDVLRVQLQLDAGVKISVALISYIRV